MQTERGTHGSQYPQDEANLPGVGSGRGLFVGSVLGSGVIFRVGSAYFVIRRKTNAETMLDEGQR